MTFHRVYLNAKDSLSKVSVEELQHYYRNGELKPDALVQETENSVGRSLSHYIDVDTWTPIPEEERHAGIMRLRWAAVPVLGGILVDGAVVSRET